MMLGQKFFVSLIFIALTFFSVKSLAIDNLLSYQQDKQKLLRPQPKIKKRQNLDKKIKYSFRKIKSSTNFEDFDFLQPIRVASSTIKDPTSLRASRFRNDVFIDKVVIQDPFNASFVLFEGGVESHYLTFQNRADFSLSIFKKDLVLHKLICEATCNYSLANIFSESIFSESVFKNSAIFSGTTFAKNTKFIAASFDQRAEFNRAQFLQGADFGRTSFRKGANFSNAQFNGAINFRGVLIDGVLNLSNAKIDQNVLELRHIEPLSPGLKIDIRLSNTDIAKVRLNYDNFKLDFAHEDTHETRENTYSALLKNFEANGLRQSYKTLFAEYRNFQNLSQGRVLSNFLAKNLWNYGLDKDWVFFWLGILFLIYTVINAAFYPTLIENYCKIEFLQKMDISVEKNLNPILRFVYFLPYSFIMTFILFAGGFLKLGVTITTFQGRSIIVLCYMLLITISGFSSLFFVLAFIL